ncbi:FAD binding domain-containing protein [Chloroflexota bacterium]
MRYFDYSTPATLSEALMLLRRYDGRAPVLAGGTDLLVSLKKREKIPEHVVNLKHIPGLDCIEYSETDGLRIGALATLQSVAQFITCSPALQDKLGLLATACNKVGTPQIRNMGTLGGNVCQGGPSQDTPPSLLVLDAKLKLVSLNGERVVPIDEFFTAPFKTALADGEILTEIQIPTPPPRSAGCYKWRTKLSTADETLVGVAVLLTIDASNVCNDIKIALTSVAPSPFRATRAEEVLRGKKIEDKLVEQAGQAAAEETRPRSRADYRKILSGVLVKRAINEVRQRLNRPA